MAVGTVSGINPDEEWQLVGSQAMSGLNTYTFSGLTGYKTYWLVGKGIANASASIPAVRINGDASTGSYAAGWSLSAGANASIFLIGPSATTARAVSFKIYDALKSIPHKVETTMYLDTGMSPSAGDAYIDPVAITSITFKEYSNINFTGGTVYLYGIAG